jgi:hypothetical protein
MTQPPVALAPIRITPSLDPTLAFELSLPSGWRHTRDHHAELCRVGLPVPLAVFEDTAGSALVAVSATRLPFEIDLEDWCRFRCVESGWDILSSRPITDPGATFVHELVARRPGGIMRSDAALLDGPRLIQMHAIGPALDAAGLAGWASHWGFRLLDARGTPRIEPRATVCFGHEFELEVPESWNVRTPTSVGAAAVDLVLGQRTWIGVRTHRHGDVRSDVEARRAGLRAELLDEGIAVDREGGFDRPRTSILAALPGWASGRIFAAVGPGPVLCEVRMWHRELDDHHVDAVLVIDQPITRRMTWMRAIRALEIAIASVRTAVRR